jgi:hypothetical protein
MQHADIQECWSQNITLYVSKHAWPSAFCLHWAVAVFYFYFKCFVYKCICFRCSIPAGGDTFHWRDRATLGLNPTHPTTQLPPKGHIAICSRSHWYIHIKSLSDDGKSVSVSVIPVIITRIVRYSLSMCWRAGTADSTEQCVLKRYHSMNTLREVTCRIHTVTT